MSQDLRGRIALVTGSGQGIGRAIAQLFAAQGASVMLATRSAASGDETLRLIRQAGGTAELLPVDLGTRNAAEQAVAATLEAFGASTCCCTMPRSFRCRSWPNWRMKPWTAPWR